MAGQTLAAADAVLKEYYPLLIVEQLNQKSYALDQFERTSQHVDHLGRRAIVPVHKNRNRGRRPIADGGTLPKAGKQDFLDAIIQLRYHTLSIEVTDAAMQASKSDQGAFVSLLTVETQGAAVDMRKDINRQVFGLGNGALVGKESVKTTGAESKVTFASENDLQYILVGDIVDIVKESDGTVASKGVESAEVIERSVSGKEIVLSKNTAGEVKTTDKFQVYISGNRNQEMDGLRNITENERTLHSINSAAAGNAFWKANTLKVGTSASAPAVAGETKFEELADNVGAQGNGEVETILTSRGIKRRLADSYQSQKRFNDAEAVKVHGGYTAIMVNEVPVVADDDAVKQFAFAVNKSAFKWFEQSPPGFLEIDNGGGVFHLKVAAAGEFAAAWQAFFRWSAALACIAPNRTGRLEFCTDDVPF